MQFSCSYTHTPLEGSVEPDMVCSLGSGKIVCAALTWLQLDISPGAMTTSLHLYYYCHIFSNLLSYYQENYGSLLDQISVYYMF